MAISVRTKGALSEMRELICITEREAFTAGFILAIRIMVEVVQGLESAEDL